VGNGEGKKDRGKTKKEQKATFYKAQDATPPLGVKE